MASALPPVTRHRYFAISLKSRSPTLPHRQRRISHNGLRTVLSGTRLLAVRSLAGLGRRRKDQDIQSEHTD
jgi:hypothetical protein